MKGKITISTTDDELKLWWEYQKAKTDVERIEIIRRSLPTARGLAKKMVAELERVE